MKIVVTGASGHIGSYLVPMLVQAGHSVISITRGRRLPFYPGMVKFQKIESKKGVDIIPPPDGIIENVEYKKIWDNVEMLYADRKNLENENKFGNFVASLNPDIVIDLICYTMNQARQLADAITGKVLHYIQIGTIWIFGYNITSPADESHPRNARGEYGEGKAAVEQYLLSLSELKKLPVTIIHPGHVVGKGWIPLNPQGNFNLNIFNSIKKGNKIYLPDMGLQTVHHVHAKDVARLIVTSINMPKKATSQVFMSTSSRAITLRGFTEQCYNLFNHSVNIEYVSYHKFLAMLNEKDAIQSDEHISRSPCVSMENAKAILGYTPEYSSIAAIAESLNSLEEMGLL